MASVFISYETKTGIEYARQAKRVFTEAGCQTWVWEDDHKATGYPREDIIDSLNACDFFLCICTKASDTSEGQRFECNHALELHKQPFILTFDPTLIPKVLTAHIYELVTPRSFDATCRKLAHDFDRYPRLTTRSVFKAEDEQL